MPFLDGTESTKEILEYEAKTGEKHIPIIALTANALKGDRERFLEAGLDEYTTKPLVRSEIVTILNHFLIDFIVEVNSDSSNESEKVLEVNVASPSESKKSSKVNELKELSTKKSEEPIAIERRKVKLEETAPKAIVQKVEYKADILLAKKSLFETKLYAKILTTLGYTYHDVHTSTDLHSEINNASYKLIMFDKECEGLSLKPIHDDVNASIKRTNLSTKLILINNSTTLETEQDQEYVDEIIKNVINKDQLKLLFEKHI